MIVSKEKAIIQIGTGRIIHKNKAIGTVKNCSFITDKFTIIPMEPHGVLLTCSQFKDCHILINLLEYKVKVNFRKDYEQENNTGKPQYNTITVIPKKQYSKPIYEAFKINETEVSPDNEKKSMVLLF